MFYQNLATVRIAQASNKQKNKLKNWIVYFKCSWWENSCLSTEHNFGKFNNIIPNFSSSVEEVVFLQNTPLVIDLQYRFTELIRNV